MSERLRDCGRVSERGCGRGHSPHRSLFRGARSAPQEFLSRENRAVTASLHPKALPMGTVSKAKLVGARGGGGGFGGQSRDETRERMRRSEADTNAGKGHTLTTW